MLLVYTSRTGNVKRFISKLDFPSIPLTENLEVNEPYVLLTYTDKFGEVPEHVKVFLEQTNGEFLEGVASSGNRNWGPKFAKAADIISLQYHVPVALKFEIAGTKKDVEIFKKKVEVIKDGASRNKAKEPHGVEQ
jgi:protein involved in ribonucleotide reduction